MVGYRRSAQEASSLIRWPARLRLGFVQYRFASGLNAADMPETNNRWRDSSLRALLRTVKSSNRPDEKPPEASCRR